MLTENLTVDITGPDRTPRYTLALRAINTDDFMKDDFTTADGRYYTFSFWAPMPKLNTNNPEVVKYFSDLCCYWAREWDIDGIRFDVGDEISHSFIRKVHEKVRAVKPEIYLLGEIWVDSLNWLHGDEYDAVYVLTDEGRAYLEDRENESHLS